MRSLPVILLLFVLLSGCSRPTPEELAALAAKGYYDHLLRGEYEQFLEGKDGADSLPEAYREELKIVYKQFMAIQDNSHHGIREVRISNAKTDMLHKYISVFLVLCFGDSTNEEIVVPMVENGGGWRMK